MRTWRRVVHRLAFCGVAAAVLSAPAPVAAQIRNPCNVITRTEAEAVVGGPLIGPQPSPQGTLCKYYESGYGESPSRIRLVTIGVWVDQPDREAVNTRRLAVMRDSSLLPLRVRELGSPGDAAIWVWAGNRLGALYAFRGGTVEVAVKISGAKQDAALAAAKRFAIRALGSAGKSSFAYAWPQMPITFREYYAPRILSSLYLGTFGQLADDPLTRSYILSLGQSFNTICPSVPDPLALLQYGYYNEYNGQKDMFKSAFAGDAPKMFHDVVNLFKRVRPHMVDIAYDDAKTFVIFQQEDIPDDFQIDPADCMSPQMTHLYANIARLAEERRTLPPDVEDDAGFFSQLRADAQKQLGFDPRAPRAVTPAQAMKKGCSEHTAGAAASGEATAMEIYCRCLVDAAIMAGLPAAAMRTLGAAFDDRSLKDAGDQYPSFAAEKKACYH
ncbi:MAG TPA: hypothetical protein VN677_06245 [Gemmatimonadaceae bacterium]|nr:hypothetical protein [Gemmatimonadaceae bacterium]